MTRSRTLALGLTAGLVLACPTRTARADPQEVTIVAGPRAALAHRLTQELEASGIVVHVEGDQPAGDGPALLVVVPQEEGAPIEIWAVKDGKSSLVASVASEGPADTRVLRAAELARALAGPATRPAEPAPPAAPVPAAPTPRPAPPPPAPPSPFVPWALQPAYRPPAEPTPPFLDVGLAVALGLQAQGASLQLEGSLRLWPGDHFGIGLFASAPLTGALVRENIGTATVRSALFGLELETSPTGRTGPFGIVLAPGLALDYLNVSGEAEAPFVSLGGDALLAAVYARLEARIAIAGPLRLTIGGLGGAAIPAVDITFDGTVSSTFSPFGSASLGVVLEP